MHKIAIIKVRELDLDYSSELIIDKVTDFEEVDDETYKLLVDAQRSEGFRIIEVPKNTSEYIQNTVTAWKAKVLRQEKMRLAELAEAAKLKLQRDLKRRAKNEAKEKELLAELMRKHGVPGDAPADATANVKSEVKSRAKK